MWRKTDVVGCGETGWAQPVAASSVILVLRKWYPFFCTRKCENDQEVLLFIKAELILKAVVEKNKIPAFLYASVYITAQQITINLKPRLQNFFSGY